MKAMNGHTLAYVAIHGELPPVIQVDREDPGRRWKGWTVDANLLDSWLETVNNLHGATVVSVCGGHGPLRPSHIVFYLKEKRHDKKTVQISGILNNIKGVWSIVDEGNLNRPRICVASPVMAGTEEGHEWWSIIPLIIDACLVMELSWGGGEK